MRASPLALLAASLLLAGLLSGCTGYPPGAAHAGDTVTVHYQAFDLTTGTPLSNGTVDVALGAGGSALGDDLTHALLGHQTNDTVTVESRNDPGRAFTQTLDLAGSLSPQPLPPDRPEPISNLPYPPSMGANYTDNGGQKYVVIALNETTATLSPVFPDQPLPQYGLVLHPEKTASAVETLVRPMDGPKPSFVAQANQYFPKTGTYQVVGLSNGGANVTFRYSAVQDPALVGHDLRIVATVLRVTHGSIASLAPGERFSPIVGRTSAT